MNNVGSGTNDEEKKVNDRISKSSTMYLNLNLEGKLIYLENLTRTICLIRARKTFPLQKVHNCNVFNN